MNGSAAGMQGSFPVVLVVTHHADRLLHLQRLFRTHHMQVITAVDGADGLRAAIQHLPDVVVAEAYLPLLDGYALAYLLQANPPTAEIPVVLIKGPLAELTGGWRRYVSVDAVLDDGARAASLAQAVRDAIQRSTVPGARPHAPASAERVQTPITDLVARDIMRAEIGKLARFTGAGNRHQMARAMFDVLSAAMEYRAAGAYFLQPTYATFFLHTRESLPSDQINGLLSHAVAPLRGALRGAIRLELFSGNEESPRELGRWTPRVLSVPASLPVTAQLLQWADETLGTLVALPGTIDPRLDTMLRHFAEQFAQVLAGLYLFEECQLLRRERARDVAPPALVSSARDAQLVERLLRGDFGPLNPAQHRALLGLRAASEPQTAADGRAEDRREPTDPRALVYEVCARVQTIMRDKHLRFEARLPASVPTLLLDRAAIAHGLTHLLRNAATHTPPGGSVTLWVAVEDQQVRIAVQDTGVGIDQAKLRELFTPAANGAGGGSGLRQCKAIVERHGGAVHVESAPGRGSRVVLGLPLRAADGGT